MSLRVKNETDLCGRSLRQFILAGLRYRGADESKVVRVVYARRGSRLLGLGQYGGGHWYDQGRRITLYVPREGAVDADRIARTLDHEIDHTFGLVHKDMISAHERDVSWAAGLELPRRAKRAPPSAEERRALAVAKREEHARAMLKKARTRMKRAKTIERKWAKKVAYYDRKAAERSEP